ncbi:hypothetical protein GY45DRAFT_692624 [Cubamyces sp. BRFM 1775]|nr:hypothetical protein GY45DRAFT_692624 [Cubamyces sp. BRFM 1775]
MTSQKALHNGDILYCIFSKFNTRQFDYRRDDPQHSERARREVLARSARVCKAFRDIALPVLWAHLHNFAPFFRLLSTCMVVQEKNLGARMGIKRVYALGEGSVPQGEIERLRYYSAFLRAVQWNNQTTLDTPGNYDYIEGSALKQLRRLVGDTPSNPLLPNLDTLSWKLTLTVDPASLSILMSPNLKTLQMDSVYDRGEWQPLIEQLLLASLSTAPDLENLSVDCTAYYSELRLSPEVTRPISELRSLRSLTLLFPTHETYNEIGLDVVLGALRPLAPLRRLERLEFRPGRVVAGSTVPPPGSRGEPLFPNLQQLKFHQVSCETSSRVLFEALRTPSLQGLEATFEYRNDAALKETFATMARCFPNLQSLWSIISNDDNLGHIFEDDLRSPLTEVIAPLLTVRSMVMLIIVDELRPRRTVGDADLGAISTAWPRLKVLDLASFPPAPSPHGWAGIGMPSLASFATRCPDLRRLSLSTLDMQSLKPSRVFDDEYPRTDNQLRSLTIRNVRGTDADCAPCGRALDRLFPHLSVAENLPSVKPGSLDTAETYIGPHQLRYKLFSAIQACQHARK